MKTNKLYIIAVMILLLSLLTACRTKLISIGNDPAGKSQPSQEITVEEAENAALTHAGLSRDQVSLLHADLDYDDGISLYDVQFYHDGLEYEYEVRASDGKILSFDKDRD